MSIADLPALTSTSTGSDYGQLFNQTLEQLGYTKDPTTGKITSDPNNPMAQIRTANQTRLLGAYQGTAQVDPTLERSLAEQEHAARSRLEGNLGPGYETSSAGIAALGDIRRNAAMARFSANQNIIQTGEQTKQQNIADISGLTGSTGNMALQQQAMQNELNIRNAQIAQSGQNALYSGISQLAGSGAGAYATYAALA